MKRLLFVVLLALSFASAPASALAGGAPQPQKQQALPSHAQMAAAVNTAEQYPVIKHWLARYPKSSIRIKLGFRFPVWAVSFYAPAARNYGFLHRGQLLQVALVDEDMTTGQVTFAERNPFTPDLGAPRNADLSSTVSGMVPRWLWALLTAVFILGLANWRRIRDWRTVDLVVFGAGFLPAFYLYGSHHDEACVLAVYPPLLYLIVRFAVALWRPASLERRWLPSAPPVVLAGLGFGLAAARIALMFVRGRVYDIGVFGQAGAHMIVHGQLPYGQLAQDIHDRGDVYGPVNYLAYTPTLPFSHHTGPQLTAILFDVGTVALLIVAGKRLAGWGAAAALAFAWLANPFTLYVLMQTANDSLVALLLAGAFAVVSWPWLRGAVIALAAWTKLGPAVLVPLWIAPAGEKRQALKTVGGAAAISILVGLMFLIGGHPFRNAHRFYSATVSWEFARQAWDPLSVWAWAPIGFFSKAFSPSLAIEREILTGALALAGLALLALRRVSVPRLAAGSVMLLSGVQVVAPYWFFNYIVWLIPVFAAALFTGTIELEPKPAEASAEKKDADSASMQKKRAASSAGKRRRCR